MGRARCFGILDGLTVTRKFLAFCVRMPEPLRMHESYADVRHTIQSGFDRCIVGR